MSLPDAGRSNREYSELVAAVSEAGGFGVVQPISLTHLYGHDFREGLQLIRSLTSRPFGVNFTIVDNAKYRRHARHPPPGGDVAHTCMSSAVHGASCRHAVCVARRQMEEWMEIAVDEGVAPQAVCW